MIVKIVVHTLRGLLTCKLVTLANKCFQYKAGPCMWSKIQFLNLGEIQ
jgi:hypothetical protein